MPAKMMDIKELMQQWEKRFGAAPGEINWSTVPPADRPIEMIHGLSPTYSGVTTDPKSKRFGSVHQYRFPEEAYLGRGIPSMHPEGAKQAMAGIGGLLQQYQATAGGLAQVALRTNILKEIRDRLEGLKVDPKAAGAAFDEAANIARPGQAVEMIKQIMGTQLGATAGAEPLGVGTKGQATKPVRPERTGEYGADYLTRLLDWLVDPIRLEQDEESALTP